MDPYAPPRALTPAPPASAGTWIAWLYAALAALRVGVMTVYYLGVAPAEYLRFADPIVRVLAFACSITALFWIHAAFGHVNRLLLDRGRLPRLGTTPGGAVGRFFVPFYNLYWCFAVHVFLARGLRELGRGRESVALLGVGVVGSAAQLLVGVLATASAVLSFRLGLVIPVIWVVYMILADRACSMPEQAGDPSTRMA
jgi:hypothetical protein